MNQTIIEWAFKTIVASDNFIPATTVIIVASMIYSLIRYNIKSSNTAMSIELEVLRARCSEQAWIIERIAKEGKQ